MGRPAALGIAVVLSLTAVAGCGSGPTVAAELWTGPRPTTTAMSAADARAIDAIGEQVVGAQLPGVWIGVWDAEKGNHIGAYGKAVLPDIPATPDDHGRIGSVSKTFTTATAMRLVDRGKLAMDSTVAQVVPDLAKRYPALAR